jgi:acyl-homoserine-lactone acylase
MAKHISASTRTWGWMVCFRFTKRTLQSEEGLNIEGCMFQGSTSLAMGVNEHLGWGMTWNNFDKVDVFKLNMNPKNKLQYEFDGNWLKLEKKPVWLKVNLSKKGHFVLPVKKMTYWSKYGTTLKSRERAIIFTPFAFPATQLLKPVSSCIKMSKAKNYYRRILECHSHTRALLYSTLYMPMINDNIFYIHHGMMPDRDTTIDWSGLVPGNSSKTLWTKLDSAR